MKRVATILCLIALTLGGVIGALSQDSSLAASVDPVVGAEVSRNQTGETTLTIGFYANVTSIDSATACSREDAKVTTKLYDLLVAHGMKTLEDGVLVSNVEFIEPRLPHPVLGRRSAQAVP